ncbi:light-inducible protein CPRF3 [Daucus carota subsp. sativus]|uniref:light-inducible protein CPRF3 n=1 Tax=Daucus carota subsp. sativus TaxID=79200 RepID=UPI003082E686
MPSESVRGKDRHAHQMLGEGPVDTISATGSNPSDSVSPGVVAVEVIPDQRDKFELRREKRKQTNRESARRSRLRKQYEYEELQHRVHALNNENHFLRKELQKVSEECNKVTSENDSIKAELLKICGQKNYRGSN